MPIKVISYVILFTLLVFANCTVRAHQPVTEVEAASATYLGNEGIMIEYGEHKILFDPFFHNNFGIYQLVPEQIRTAIMQGKIPYQDIDAIFISHAHDDHFSAQDMLQFLLNHPSTVLVAPKQAVDKLTALKPENANQLEKRIHAVSLGFGDQPWRIEINGLSIDAVRIPHAGWPGRANIENLVFRVGLGQEQAQAVTVMHMGDADPDDDHFRPFKAHWQRKVTDTAFPPYWFFYSMEGNDILTEHINAREHIGIHVPVKVPKQLKQSGKAYFSTPGQQVQLEHQY